jgi:hypothetical protein
MKSLVAVTRSLAVRLLLRPTVVLTTVSSVAGSGIRDLRGHLPVHKEKTYPTRSIEDVNGVVFHHTATTSASLRSVADFHINGRGWPAIAYHIAIGHDGQVYLLNDFTTASYHSAGHNRKNIGIVLIGNYEEREMTPEMKDAVLRVLEWVESEVNIQHILLHKDTKATACPGKYAIAYLRPLQLITNH